MFRHITIPRLTAVLTLCIFTLISVTFSQERANSLHPESKKEDSLKLVDSTRILKGQGNTRGVSANALPMNRDKLKSQILTPRINGELGKNITESTSTSSVESHRSEGISIETNNPNFNQPIINLNDFLNYDNIGTSNGWNSNIPTAIRFARINDESNQITITCQDESVYFLKYFEVGSGTEYEIYFIYSGQESNLTVEEFNANNQPIVEAIHKTIQAKSKEEKFTMKFRTNSETRRIFFRIEVSSNGTLVLNKLLFQPVETLRRDGK